MKFTPAPRACSTIRRASATSVWSANIIVPRQSAETWRGLLPRGRYCMVWFQVLREKPRTVPHCPAPGSGLTRAAIRFDNGMVAPLKDGAIRDPRPDPRMNFTEEQLAFRDSV